MTDRTEHPDAERHVCGLEGYNPEIDPPCPACNPDAEKGGPRHDWVCPRCEYWASASRDSCGRCGNPAPWAAKETSLGAAADDTLEKLEGLLRALRLELPDAVWQDVASRLRALFRSVEERLPKCRNCGERVAWVTCDDCAESEVEGLPSPEEIERRIRNYGYESRPPYTHPRPAEAEARLQNIVETYRTACAQIEELRRESVPRERAASDRLAVAVLELIDLGYIRTRTPVCDALEAYADLRFDVRDGSGIQRLRGIEPGETTDGQ